MPAISNYLAAKLQDHVLQSGGADYTPPATLYLALHIADPGPTGLNELSGGSYARKAITFALSSPDAGNDSGAVYTDLPATTITHMALWDALAGGNMLFYGACSPSVVIPAGDGFEVGLDEFAVSI